MADVNSVVVNVLEGGKKPVYKTTNSSCADCYARLADEEITLKSGERCLVNLGFTLSLPFSYEAQIRPRSGLSKHGIDIAFGTVDSDYTGEIKACVINNSKGDFVIRDGDRICQLYIGLTFQHSCFDYEHLKRGDGGFGSTGTN